MSHQSDVEEIRRLNELYATAVRTHDPRDWARYHLALKAASGKYGIPFRPVMTASPKLGRAS